MNREEAEQYLYYAMIIGEQLLISGAEVGRVEDTIRRIGILGKEGMYETDNVILRMMLDRSTV